MRGPKTHKQKTYFYSHALNDCLGKERSHRKQILRQDIKLYDRNDKNIDSNINQHYK